MFYIYLIKSRKDKKLYIGLTTQLNKRLQQHNEGVSQSTKLRRPFDIVYYEAYRSSQDAHKREKNLKLFSKAYYALKRRISDSLDIPK